MPEANEFHTEIAALSRSIAAEQLAWRRHLHAYPELSNQEFQTTRYIRERLNDVGISILPLDLPTGVLAEIRGKLKGRTVAVRADIDALPILEQTNLPFASKNTGCMHACGHDVHMSTVLGVATVLNRMRDKLPGRVRLLFQPSEEMPPGGARPLIEQGALKDVDMIFGLHVDPELAVGRIGLRDGPTMAAVIDFDLIVRGKAGHVGRPHLAVDAIVIAAEIVAGVQTFVSRQVDPAHPLVVSFGRVEGGLARNVVCDEVRLTGTARTLSPETARLVPKQLAQLAGRIAAAHGGKAEFERIAGYPVLSNDPAANRVLAAAWRGLGNRSQPAETPAVYGGEDFACYLERVPGAMFRLGIRNKAIKADKPWHSPQFIADEAALPVGTALLCAAAVGFLTGGR